MKKKVLYVITKGNWGGAQRYVFDLATGLRGEFDVAVACGSTGALVEKLREKEIRTIEVPSLRRDVSASSDMRAFFELLRLFRRERPDVVHLNSSKAGGVGALAARMAGVPKVVFTSHGLAWDENRNFISKTLIYLASQLTFALCHTVITISKHHQNRVRGSALVYNGIAPMEFGSGEIIRSAFPRGARIVGTVGELTRNKNQKTLIQQAKNDPSLYVAIVGEGEDRAMLEQKIREHGLQARVKLFGFVPVREALKGFDEFVLPSLKEGLPYVLLEAKLAGLPIVANRVGGVGEILDKDVSEFSLQKMLEQTAALYQRS